MNGLEAIVYHNGFSMAAVGISIVFTALVALSIIIAQLHKLLLVWDNRKALIQKLRGKRNASEAAKAPEPDVSDFHNIHEEARQFNILIQVMGEPFSLPELIYLAETRGIRHPHATAAHLITKGLVFPDNKGFFLWNHEVYNQLVKGSRH